MLMALANFIGQAALRGAVQRAVAEQVGHEAIGQLANKLMDSLERVAAQKPKILGIESETWYTFHMAQERYWTQANRFLSDQMGERMRSAYNDIIGRASVLPFALSAAPTEEGLTLYFRKAPRSVGYDRALCYDATVTSVRKSMKAYIRMVAAGVPIEG